MKLKCFFYIFAALCFAIGAGAAETPPPKPSAAPSPNQDVPSQNVLPGKKPDLSGLTTLAGQILSALSGSAPPPARDVVGFFPRAPFLVLKNIPMADAYHLELTKKYTDDLTVIRKQLPPEAKLTLDRFTAGSCKWKAVGSEYNQIAYWSCYGSLLVATSEAPTPTSMTLKVRTLINWGTDWYVTHLGNVVAVTSRPEITPTASATQKTL